MDLDLTESETAFRAECREWLRANVPGEPLKSLDTEEGFAAHVEWEKKLHGAGWAVVSWPKAYGGRDASLTEWLIFEEEYYAAGAPGRVTQNGIFLLAPTIFEFGTKEQQDRILPRMSAAEDLWAQCWSEPESGSDLASLRSRAEKVDGGWKLYGQKTWCSRGSFADWGFGPFRTEKGSERHKGLSYMMFDLRADGCTVRPIHRLDGEPSFAEVFLDGVFVPDEDVLGDVGAGWKVAMSTTGSERGLSLRSPGRFLATAQRLVELWRQSPEQIQAETTEEVVDAWLGAQAYRLSTFETVTGLLKGGQVGAESSLNKVFWSEWDINAHETALRLLSDRGEIASPIEGALGSDGSWQAGYVFSLAGPIYAGTNEIQRNVIAERVLGLPRK